MTKKNNTILWIIGIIVLLLLIRGFGRAGIIQTIEVDWNYIGDLKTGPTKIWFDAATTRTTSGEETGEVCVGISSSIKDFGLPYPDASAVNLFDVCGRDVYIPGCIEAGNAPENCIKPEVIACQKPYYEGKTKNEEICSLWHGSKRWDKCEVGIYYYLQNWYLDPESYVNISDIIAKYH